MRGTKTIHVKIPEGKMFLGAALGLRLTHWEAVVQRLKEGLPIAAFERLSASLDISTAKLAEVAGIAQRTLARRKREGRLILAESERVFRLAALFDKAKEVLGGTERARQWFKAPKQALHGKSPFECAETEIGAREVEDLLGRLEHGVFS